jgi:hypothetical protein
MEPAYIHFLMEQVDHAVGIAHDRAETVTVERGSGECAAIGINRRLPKQGKIEMAPNPAGLVDPEVTVIRFCTPAKQVKGVLFHFACHPTTTSDNRVTSEYCGAAMEELDRQLGDGISCFLQGCCGDVRPALHKDGAFFSGNERDVREAGGQLASEVLDILSGPMTALRSAELRAWTTQVELPFQRVPDPAELQADPRDPEIVRMWKRLLLDNPHRLTGRHLLSIQLMQICDELSWIAMNGEIVTEYGLFIKQRSQSRTLPLGYSNGMIGYVPTARQLREGGYESERSTLPFGYPSPFQEQIEVRIQSAISALLSERTR